MNLKIFFLFFSSLFASSAYLLPSRRDIFSKTVYVCNYSNIEESFHEGICHTMDRKGIFIMKFKKLDRKLIEYMCEENKDIYDFSRAVYTNEHFIWRKIVLKDP